MMLKRFNILIFAPLLMLFSCAAGMENAKLAQAHYKLGISYLNEEKLQPAFVEFQKALELDKNNREIYNVLGITYLRLDDFEKAEESFNKAVSLDKNYSDAYNNLCFVQYSMKKYEAAVSNCKLALKNPLYETPEKAFYNLGRSYYRLRMFDEAIDSYNKALRRLPGLYPAYYSLALAFNAKGIYGEASTAISSALELDPLFKGDRTKAEEYFKTAKTKDLDEKEDLKNFLDIIKY
jgi:type IV pilus assembly protein PilF